jgi:segregation and condensation protein A
VIGQLAEMEEVRSSKWHRGNVVDELKKLSRVDDVDAELQDLDLFKLLKVYQKVIHKFVTRTDDTKHTVIQYPYTIEQQKNLVLEELSRQPKIAFTDFILMKPDKIFVIYTFLAILELLQLSLVTIRIGDGFNNFWVEKLESLSIESL